MTDPAAVTPEVDALALTVRNALWKDIPSGETRQAATAALSDLAARARKADKLVESVERGNANLIRMTERAERAEALLTLADDIVDAYGRQFVKDEKFYTYQHARQGPG